ncbi:threonine synthase [Chryseosolibacter indicus]|uniref:Threonine synthase n=1 Tax=Chryseosolibacter indicus TaxID=2782351 RepID=A0ABS5VLR7_9BACT|nr:threonine synthase [Chryseosolibacter indicus]MBT1702402.1 threonine synthase [Chryseosolibacter indicus]
MKYYSTNNKNRKVTLREAVIEGLAPDNGLYMPEQIPVLPPSFFQTLHERTFKEIAYEVAQSLIGDDLPKTELGRIIDHTIQFDAPLVEVEKDTFALELFHGPTLAFKDFGARFMSQLLGYFAKEQKQEITVLVATSGDTGSAVANGFLGVEGTRVIVLYPGGKVSDIQEKQFTTLGKNITAIEVDGTFDDCQSLVKQAFLDGELKQKFFLTSANSINISRLVPQSFYYFYAYSRLVKQNKPVIFSVPSGNFGNLTGGVLASKMGLPIYKFIAATNVNDVVPVYLETKEFTPRPSKQTISNAMDVGNPSNFARLNDIFGGDHNAITDFIKGYAFTDSQTSKVLAEVYANKGYLMDPHGAIGYLGLRQYREENKSDFIGVFLETAHPGKFKDTVEHVIGAPIHLPEVLQNFLQGRKNTIKLGTGEYKNFKKLLLEELVSA